MAGSRTGVSVPPFLELAAHPIRWQLLSALARSDRNVSELTGATGATQALVSYHLGRLRAGGLVAARRSSHDGRVAYYRVRLDRCASLLAEAGEALHPGVAATRRAPPPTTGRRRARPTSRVLFACTGNSARSLLAEALLRQRTGGTVAVVSGGSRPKPVHPNTVAVLEERGIDPHGLRSKSLDEFAGHAFDHVVTLCDRVREVCPEFPGDGTRTHWSTEDPGALPGTARRTLPAFRALADELDGRLAFLCARLDTDHEEDRNHGR